LAHRKIHCTVSSSRRNLSKPFRSPLISSTSRINKNTSSPQPAPSSMEYEEADVSSSFSSNATGSENRLVKPHLRSPLITVKSAGAASRPFRSPLTTSHSSRSDRRVNTGLTNQQIIYKNWLRNGRPPLERQRRNCGLLRSLGSQTAVQEIMVLLQRRTMTTAGKPGAMKMANKMMFYLC